MRDYDTDYRYADVINRRARWGVLVVIALLFGVAWAGSANDDGGPPPSVLAGLVATSSSPTEVVAAVEESTTTTTRPVTTTTVTPQASSTTVASTTTAPSTTRPSPTSTSTSTTTIPTTTTTTSTTTTTLPATTTTTTIPSTTTTSTIAPPTTTTTVATRGTIHIHDLTGDEKRNDAGPYAKIEVQIRNDSDKNQSGVLVTGRFSRGSTGSVAGTTNNRGMVVFESGPVDADAVTFTVIDLSHPEYLYEPDDNRRGPSVTVEFN